MKYCLILIGALFFIQSCTDKTEDASLIEEGELLTVDSPDTCQCDILTEDEQGIFLLEDSLFTGVCIYNYPESDQKYMVKSILKGNLHGSVTYFDRQGNVLVEEIYEGGLKKRSGNNAPLECDCSELTQVESPGETIKRSFLDGIPYTGKCEEKYTESEQTYMEVNYSNGIMNGFTIFYDKMGKTMYMEEYENGELIKIIHQEN